MAEKQRPIGVIFASGKGSRLHSLTDNGNNSKHLLPIPDKGRSYGIISRIVRQFQLSCGEIYCTVDQGKKTLFEDEFERQGLDVRVLEKESSGFKGDMECIRTHIVENNQECQILQTAGDLIFPDGAILKFANSVSNDRGIVLGIREQVRPHICITKLPGDTIGDLESIDPESWISFLKGVQKIGTSNISSLPVEILFNINTPADYHAAVRHLS